MLLRWLGDGHGLPRSLDGAWASVMSVSRDRVTVQVGSPRGTDLHCVALAAVERVEREGEPLSPSAPEGPIAPPGTPAPVPQTPAEGDDDEPDEDAITESRSAHRAPASG